VAGRDIAELTGLTSAPIASRVSRWGGGLPQYAVGHPDRVRRIRDAVATVRGLAVAGAAYDGVGIPACIRSGQTAAAAVLAGLREARGDLRESNA
jgi:oxygen-dependent protoporphyrinogen oxidase